MELLQLDFARAKAARGLTASEARSVLRLLVHTDDEQAAGERLPAADAYGSEAGAGYEQEAPSSALRALMALAAEAARTLAAEGELCFDDEGPALAAERAQRARNALALALRANEQMEQAARDAKRRAARARAESQALRTALVRAERACASAESLPLARLPAMGAAATRIQAAYRGVKGRRSARALAMAILRGEDLADGLERSEQRSREVATAAYSKDLQVPQTASYRQPPLSVVSAARRRARELEAECERQGARAQALEAQLESARAIGGDGASQTLAPGALDGEGNAEKADAGESAALLRARVTQLERALIATGTTLPPTPVEADGRVHARGTTVELIES